MVDFTTEELLKIKEALYNAKGFVFATCEIGELVRKNAQDALDIIENKLKGVE